MKIGGLQRVSLIDYPGLISAVVFLQGCNFKCSYCHNPELVDPRLFQPCLRENDIFDFLDTRKGKLDAVSITGGEPTLQDKLPAFIKHIRKMGFAVKMDTNGSQPKVIRNLLAEKLLDFIAMDIKAPLEKYKDIVKATVNPDSIKESINLILKAKIPYEFRTTIVESQLGENDILQIGKLIAGADHYVLQNFVSTKTLDKKFLKEKPFSDEKLQKIKSHLEKQITSVTIR
ncbi:MAG: anaerobic ribonucleoside-triphosphate reductase activating protein [Deltaproteobacteria bacterium HGW-Deltaproteobacteria-13]|jgi:pyruvate formate lyase activating enzyme|nr:MAG: anaerobic ribonucleoside-triphosphate reductase activating protein [Deltaproteobacteria bacterium HGW-Deltaproteobacteria-13]